MKVHIRAILDCKLPTPYTDDELLSIPSDQSYMVSCSMHRSREGEPAFFDLEGRDDGLCKVRMNGYTIIANEDFAEIQDYVRGLESKIKDKQL